MKVVSVVKYGPSHGIMEVGDIILEIDGKDISGMGISELRDRILGEEATDVDLRLMRDGEYYEVTLMRSYNIKPVGSPPELASPELTSGEQYHYPDGGPNSAVLSHKRRHKNYNNSVCEVNWAASNNVFIKYSILKNNKLLFDINLNKFGIGEDQLFFSLLKKRGNSIYWNKNVKVYEKSHFHRTNLLWLVKRSFRLGVLGHYLDKKIHGVIFGYNYNYVKSLYYLLKSFLYMLLFFNKYSRINAINFFARFIGRVSGPFVFKKIDFLKI